MGNIPGVKLNWDRVEYYLSKKGMSHNALARAIHSDRSDSGHISPQAIIKWKNGTAGPSKTVFRELVNVLDADPLDIMAPDQDPEGFTYEGFALPREPLSILSMSGCVLIGLYVDKWPGMNAGITARQHVHEYKQKKAELEKIDSKDIHLYYSTVFRPGTHLIYEFRLPDNSTICIRDDNLMEISDTIEAASAAIFKSMARAQAVPPDAAAIDAG